MPSTAPAASAGATLTTLQHPFKPEIKPFLPYSAEMPGPSSSSGPIRVDGSEYDVALSKSDFLSRAEVISRRARRVKQLARIYRDHYWALMEELKLKYREYYWEYGKSPFIEDEEGDKINSNRGESSGAAAEIVQNGNFGVNGGINHNGNASNRCGVYGCKAKAMALTRFCHMHILSDPKQKLYKSCKFSIKSSTSGPIICGKPILRSTVPSYCPLHFQKAEKHMSRAIKKAGHTVPSTSRLSPKLHWLIPEYTHQVLLMRKTAEMAPLGNTDMKEECNP